MDFLLKASKQLLLREEGEWFCRRRMLSTQWWYNTGHCDIVHNPNNTFDVSLGKTL